MTNDTVSPDNLAVGATAHDKAGNLVTGEMERGYSITSTDNGDGTQTWDVSGNPSGANGVEEVTELPPATPEMVGKYVKYNDVVYECVSEPIQDGNVYKNPVICFDTTKNPSDYVSNYEDSYITVMSGNTAEAGFFAIYYAEIEDIKTLLYSTDEGDVAFWIDSEEVSLEHFNENMSSELGGEIESFGWQTERFSQEGDWKLYISDSIMFSNLFLPISVWKNKLLDNFKGLVEGELTELVIPEGTTKIRDYAFYHSTLQSITIPNSVTSFGNSAFGYCESLTDINIPNGITAISNSAFNYCGELTTVNKRKADTKALFRNG